MKPLSKQDLKNDLKIAKERLLEGNLVIFPTETVYGLGADATNFLAIKKIYNVKNRPLENPLICHFENFEKLSEEVEVNDMARKLAKKFWPGPMTLILKKQKKSKISPNVSNNKSLIGCRIPDHPIALKILKSLERPIAAPSANYSTKLSTTSINHIDRRLKAKAYIIDGGVCNLGLESTVINVCINPPQILRYGSITLERIRRLIPRIDFNTNKKTGQLSPGQKYKHYSPNLPIRINVDKVLEDEVLLNFGSNNLTSNIYELNLSIKADLNEAAKNFFNYLHRLDIRKYKSIAVAPIPNTGLGITINDRLKKAIINK